jgi:hypothetical protein
MGHLVELFRGIIASSLLSVLSFHVTLVYHTALRILQAQSHILATSLMLSWSITEVKLVPKQLS